MRALYQILLIVLTCLTASADTLRLRDGRILSGQFLGATRSEIWFQRDVPGEILGKEAFPVMQVESLTFGPSARAAVGSRSPRRLPRPAASSTPAPPALKAQRSSI
jgi:hypothetical protein